jgi:CDP-diacylglycerol--glycerol-3-phosphate 3-phosphatidyltransferase
MIEGLKPVFNAVLRPFALLISKLGIHPNVLTVFGVVLFGIGGWLTVQGYWRWALLVMIIGACLDGLDGVVAREADKKSIFGSVLDSICDRFTEIIWLGSLIWYYMKNPILDGLCIYLAFAALTGSFMVSYVKARANSAGILCDKGFMQRPERLIVLSTFQFIGPRIMPWGLGIVAGLTYLTVFQRIYIVWRNYKKKITDKK